MSNAPKKLSNKTLVIITCCIIALPLAIFVISLMLGQAEEEEYEKRAIMYDIASSIIRIDDSDCLNVNQWIMFNEYQKYCDTEYFKEELYRQIRGYLDEEDLVQLCYTTKFLDQLGFKDDGIKKQLKSKTLDAVEASIYDDLDYADVYSYLSMIDSTNYYHPRHDYITEQTVIQKMLDYKNEAYSCEYSSLSLSSLMEYANHVDYVVNTLGISDTNELLPKEEFVKYVTENFFEVISEDGVGGYYDDKKFEYKPSTNIGTESTVDTKYYFFGDLMIETYYKKWYRPTGEDWEEELMSKYDVSGSYLYIKGEKYDGGGTLIDEFQKNNYESVYVSNAEISGEKVVIFVSEDTIVSLSGAKSFEIKY